MIPQLFYLTLFSCTVHSAWAQSNDSTITLTGIKVVIKKQLDSSCYTITPNDSRLEIVNQTVQNQLLSLGDSTVDISAHTTTINYFNSEQEREKFQHLFNQEKGLVPNPNILVELRKYIISDGEEIQLNKCSEPFSVIRSKETPDIRLPVFVSPTSVLEISPASYLPSSDVKQMLVYDGVTHNLLCYKDGEQVTLDKCYFKVGQSLPIKVININAFVDSIAPEITFQTLHQEAKTKFNQLFATTRSVVSPPEGEVVLSQGLTAQSTIQYEELDETDLLLKLEQLAIQLATYYRQIRQASVLPSEVFSNQLQLIEFQITENFQIAFIDANTLEQRLLEEILLSNLSGPDRIRANEYLMNALSTFRLLRNGLRNMRVEIQAPQIEQDLSKVTFGFFRDGKPVSSSPLSYEFHNRGGFKVDFSTGIIFHGLVNDRFATKPVIISVEPDNTGSITKYRVIPEIQSRINVGLGVFSHYYYRNMFGEKGFNLALTLGGLTRFSNFEQGEVGLNFLVGGSVIIGAQQRLVLSSGMVLGAVDRLSSGLQAGDENGTLLESNDSPIPTQKVNKLSWFLAFSYNF